MFGMLCSSTGDLVCEHAVSWWSHAHVALTGALRGDVSDVVVSHAHWGHGMQHRGSMHVS
eukprot:12993292-Alexandrium_andersonii.AAC.1